MTGETRLLYVRTPLPIFMRLLVGMLGLAFVVTFCFIIFTPADWPKTFLNWLFLLGVAFFGYGFVHAATTSERFALIRLLASFSSSHEGFCPADTPSVFQSRLFVPFAPATRTQLWVVAIGSCGLITPQANRGYSRCSRQRTPQGTLLEPLLTPSEQQQSTMSGGPRKTWQEMTRKKIFATLIAFTVIGGSIVAVCIGKLVFCICDLVFHDCGALAFSALALLVPAAGILFVVVGVGVSCIQAIRELSRRKTL